MDRLLDQARLGSNYLKLPAIAEVVAASIHYGETLEHYTLHSYVVMPNHVHLLITPRISVSRLLNSLKSVTAKRGNLLLGRTGEPFWQDESYDHLVKSGEEFVRIRKYIEYNPVTAGLVATAEQFRWSSASQTEAA